MGAKWGMDLGFGGIVILEISGALVFLVVFL